MPLAGTRASLALRRRQPYVLLGQHVSNAAKVLFGSGCANLGESSSGRKELGEPVEREAGAQRATGADGKPGREPRTAHSPPAPARISGLGRCRRQGAGRRSQSVRAASSTPKTSVTRQRGFPFSFVPSATTYSGTPAAQLLTSPCHRFHTFYHLHTLTRPTPQDDIMYVISPPVRVLRGQSGLRTRRPPGLDSPPSRRTRTAQHRHRIGIAS